MKLFEFNTRFPDEEACREEFRLMRLEHGIVCHKCGCTHHYWRASDRKFQCSRCGNRQGLRANTVMHGSKLPFRYWFIAMHLLTATKHTFSASEIQRQLGHKRYQPIWEMVHKLRSVMGARDGLYTLKGSVEIDEAFFTTETPQKLHNKVLKAGAGSQRKAKVLVMAESTAEPAPKDPKRPKKVQHIKMVVVPDTKAATLDGVAAQCVERDSVVSTDASSSHNHFKDMFREHHAKVIEPRDIGKELPWVHIVIANAKTLLADTYHGLKSEYLQEYLNEFCYKFNRRYFGEDLFDRLLSIAATYASEFGHRPYRKKKPQCEQIYEII